MISSRKLHTTTILFFVLVALLAMVGVTGVAIAEISLSLRWAPYKLEIIFMATMVQMAILAVGTVACIGLAREMKGLWQSG